MANICPLNLVARIVEVSNGYGNRQLGNLEIPMRSSLAHKPFALCECSRIAIPLREKVMAEFYHIQCRSYRMHMLNKNL